MKLPINIEELLGGKAVEDDRIEYKTGWNPDAIYRSICAFANDFNETGGGYIVMGVKEVNGRPVRPVIGIDPDQIESIEKEMVGYNNLMRPYYQPRLYIEEADGKTILVIKVSAGERRPYKVPDCVTAKQKVYNYYIRYNSSSIVPKDEYERELINLANRTPFDDRRSSNRYSYYSGRAESQRIAQSDYRDRRGADLFPDRYSLPSGIYQREGCLEQGLHKRLHKRPECRNAQY